MKENDKFSIGKYRGFTIKEVFEKDKSYIFWCFKSIENFILSDDVLKLIRLSNTQIPISVLRENIKRKAKKNLELKNFIEKNNIDPGTIIIEPLE